MSTVSAEIMHAYLAPWKSANLNTEDEQDNNNTLHTYSSLNSLLNFAYELLCIDIELCVHSDEWWET